MLRKKDKLRNTIEVVPTDHSNYCSKDEGMIDSDSSSSDGEELEKPKGKRGRKRLFDSVEHETKSMTPMAKKKCIQRLKRKLPTDS